MNFEAEGMCGPCAFNNAQPLSFRFSRMAFGNRLTPGPDMNLDRRRANARCRFDLAEFGRSKQ